MAVDPSEAHMLVGIMARQLAIRGGAINVGTPEQHAQQLGRASPRAYQEYTEDVELLIEALDKYRSKVKD